MKRGWMCVVLSLFTVGQTWGADPAARNGEAAEWQSQSTGHTVRIFRLGVAATGEFTVWHGGKAEAMAAVERIVARVTEIFEREVGVRFVLVPETDALVFEDAETDPFSTNEPSYELMREGQETFDAVVGSANYDLGIVLTRGRYGLSQLASVCDPLSKGASSFGLLEPSGDDFHAKMVAHELAHQFGAEHTFNSEEGYCGDRRREWHAFEPGSGSTLMSYAGLDCGGHGFHPENDDYFHSESLKQIFDFLTSGAAACAELEPTGNHVPSVNAGPEFTIPILTPFALTASGSDVDGDEIYYCWEERDRGPAQAWDAPDNGLSPLFRSYPPTSSPTRVFPAMEYLLRNEQAPGEQLPSMERVMRFRVVARDSRNNGAVSWADTQIFVEDSAGPFRVNSHGGAEVLREQTEVRWDVAGTAGAPVSAERVKISLSVDGGRTFPHVLVEETPNDGMEVVPLPELWSEAARIKVEAVGNIFFDVNDADLVLESDVIRITSMQRNGERLGFSWVSQAGRTYRVERADSAAGEWETVSDIVADGNLTSVEIEIRAGNEFFRVVQE